MRRLIHLRLLWLLAFAGMFLPGWLLAQGRFTGQPKFTSTPFPGGTQLFITNPLPWTITMTIELHLDNMTADMPASAVMAMAPFSNTLYCTLHQADSKQAWKWSYKFYAQPGDFQAAANTNYVYAKPFAADRQFPIGQGFNGPFSHNGRFAFAIDWLMPEGTPVQAARSGIVVDLKSDATKNTTDRNDTSTPANYVYLQHADSTIGRYLHLKPGGVIVERGQCVREGDIIGYSGNTGLSTAPHLHFDVCRPINGQWLMSIPYRYRTNDTLTNVNQLPAR